MLEVKGYNLVLADHPNNIKRGEVCIYYKKSFPVRAINLPHLNQALFLEMTFNNKKVIVSLICRSPSQNNNEFELLVSNFEQLLIDVNKRKPSLSVITGNINADLLHSGLMTSIQQRDRSCTHLLHQMGFLN